MPGIYRDGRKRRVARGRASYVFLIAMRSSSAVPAGVRAQMTEDTHTAFFPEVSVMGVRPPLPQWLWPFVLLMITVPVPGAAQTNPAPATPVQISDRQDGRHDFDFEFGEWAIKLSRLLNPLTGSTTWAEYEGRSVVRQVWGGDANLGELHVEGPTGRIRGLSLRLYNPESREWRISWANSNDGILGPAMIGGFHDGVGEFYNQEIFNGRAIYVRFIFSDISPTTFRLEQAFSADGGKSWEANWIARFSRVTQ
jgi:hypothetical protein